MICDGNEVKGELYCDGAHSLHEEDAVTHSSINADHYSEIIAANKSEFFC